jgi:hypothetical protein
MMNVRPLGFSILLAGMVGGLPAHAIPVDGAAVANASIMFVLNGGNAVDGVDISSAVLPFDIAAASALDAPDAANTTTESTIIAGFDADNPSVYERSDRTTRNAGTEGGAGNVFYSVYNDFDDFRIVEHMAEGNSQAIAQITTEPYDTSASGEASVSREFFFENTSLDEVFFTMAVDVEVSTGVLFNGAAGSARAFADARLLFDSADPLDISFSALEPYLPDEDLSGDNASNTLTRFTDPTFLGQVGLTASASALGIDAIASETASVLATDSLLLGVTLQPGQQMTVTRVFSIQTSVEIDPSGSSVPVPVPAIPALLVIGLVSLRLVRHPNR